MNVLIPRVGKNDVQVVWKPIRKEDHIIYQYKCGSTDKMMILKNKAPTWNSALNAYVLNFFGRVTMPSVKNFQLVNPENGIIQ